VAEDIRIEKEDAARTAKLYGEENRITIPHVFRHENGLATTDRATEIFMKVCMALYFHTLSAIPSPSFECCAQYFLTA
jgi:hypothetical protein